MMKPLLLFHLLFAALAISGCISNPGIVSLSPDTYIVTKSSNAGMFANMAGLKAEAIREANAFAESKGMIAIPISTNERGFETGAGYPSVEYQFRVVKKDDPEARPTSLVPRANVVIEKTEKITADVNTKESKSPDLYTELTKLDELRKKGIITDIEFAALKSRLLEAQQ